MMHISESKYSQLLLRVFAKCLVSSLTSPSVGQTANVLVESKSVKSTDSWKLQSSSWTPIDDTEINGNQKVEIIDNKFSK